MMNRCPELTVLPVPSAAAVPARARGLTVRVGVIGPEATGRARDFALADGGGHLGGAVGALLLPTLISDTTFFLGFAAIGITGLLAGLIALGGPKTSGRSLELIARPIPLQ